MARVGIRVRIALAAVVVGGAVSALGSPAAGSDAPPATPQIRQAGEAQEFMVGGKTPAPPVTDLEMQDLEQLAKRTGAKPAELAERHRGVTPFSVLAGQIEEQFPDNFAGAGLASPGERANFWILFKERPSAEAQERLAALGGVTVVRSGAPASSAEIAIVAGSIVSSLAAQGEGGYSRIGSGESSDARKMTIEYAFQEGGVSQPSVAEQRRYEAAALQAGAASSSDGRLPMTVEFIETAAGKVIRPGTTVQGGRTLFIGGAADCTGGFTASRSSGNGILTARHCQNALTYSNIAGIISTSPVGATNPPAGVIDLQWHATLTANGHTTNSQFRSTAVGTDRTVDSRANPVIGSTVCHWGDTSGYDCATVLDTNDCYLYGDGTTYCGIDETNAMDGGFGDSGGPIFFGATAYGIWNGFDDTIPNPRNNYYVRIGRVMDSLDATVLGS